MVLTRHINDRRDLTPARDAKQTSLILSLVIRFVRYCDPPALRKIRYSELVKCRYAKMLLPFAALLKQCQPLPALSISRTSPCFVTARMNSICCQCCGPNFSSAPARLEASLLLPLRLLMLCDYLENNSGLVTGDLWISTSLALCDRGRSLTSKIAMQNAMVCPLHCLWYPQAKSGRISKSVSMNKQTRNSVELYNYNEIVNIL